MKWMKVSILSVDYRNVVIGNRRNSFKCSGSKERGNWQHMLEGYSLLSLALIPFANSQHILACMCPINTNVVYRMQMDIFPSPCAIPNKPTDGMKLENDKLHLIVIVLKTKVQVFLHSFFYFPFTSYTFRDSISHHATTLHESCHCCSWMYLL